MSKCGKIFFIKTNPNKEEKYGKFYEINSNHDNLFSIQLTNSKAIGLNHYNEVIEWEKVSHYDKNKQDFSFLLTRPLYRFCNMKFTKLVINTTVCLALDKNMNLYVWGINSEGLLGLGFGICSVENPTKLENLYHITHIALSENHAVVVNYNGEAFSWGNGKYGELGLDKTIYSPFPTKLSADRKYANVYCGDLLTCFLDKRGKFSYYGVIIKVYQGVQNSVTVKSLLRDETITDPKYLFCERVIYELEKERFISLSIGNGFIGLLSDKGLVYSLDHGDNITLLFSKYYVYSLAVSNNQLFGLCKDNNRIKFPKNEVDLSTTTANIASGYCMARWVASFSENEVTSDSWTTYLYKVNDEISLEFMSLIDCKNKDILLFLQNENNSNSNYLSSNSSRLYDNNMRLNDITIGMKNSFDNELKADIDLLIFIRMYDDSYNVKYKRVKNYYGLRVISNKNNTHSTPDKGNNNSEYLNPDDEDDKENNALSNLSNKSNMNHLINTEVNQLFSPESIVQFYHDSSKFVKKKNETLEDDISEIKVNNESMSLSDKSKISAFKKKEDDEYSSFQYTSRNNTQKGFSSKMTSPNKKNRRNDFNVRNLDNKIYKTDENVLNDSIDSLDDPKSKAFLLSNHEMCDLLSNNNEKVYNIEKKSIDVDNEKPVITKYISNMRLTELTPCKLSREKSYSFAADTELKFGAGEEKLKKDENIIQSAKKSISSNKTKYNKFINTAKNSRGSSIRKKIHSYTKRDSSRLDSSEMISSESLIQEKLYTDNIFLNKPNFDLLKEDDDENIYDDNNIFANLSPSRKNKMDTTVQKPNFNLEEDHTKHEINRLKRISSFSDKFMETQSDKKHKLIINSETDNIDDKLTVSTNTIIKFSEGKKSDINIDQVKLNLKDLKEQSKYSISEGTNKTDRKLVNESEYTLGQNNIDNKLIESMHDNSYIDPRQSNNISLFGKNTKSELKNEKEFRTNNAEYFHTLNNTGYNSTGYNSHGIPTNNINDTFNKQLTDNQFFYPYYIHPIPIYHQEHLRQYISESNLLLRGVNRLSPNSLTSSLERKNLHFGLDHNEQIITKMSYEMESSAYNKAINRKILQGSNILKNIFIYYQVDCKKQKTIAFNILLDYVNKKKKKQFLTPSMRFIKSNLDDSEYISNVIVNSQLSLFTKVLVRVLFVFYKSMKKEFFMMFEHRAVYWYRERIFRKITAKKILDKEKNLKKLSFTNWLNLTHIAYGAEYLQYVIFKIIRVYFDQLAKNTLIVKIKKKYMQSLFEVSERIYVRNLKFEFFTELKKFQLFCKNYENFNNLLDITFKMIIISIRANVFKNMKLSYLRKKVYEKNLIFLVDILKSYSKIPQLKQIFFNRICERAFRSRVLKKYFVMKNNLRNFYLRKYFKLFTRNTIKNDQDNFIQKNKLKKVLKIFRYNLKLILLKYLCLWQSVTKHLSKLSKYERPIKYSICNEIKYIGKNKIPGFNNNYNIKDKINKFESLTYSHINKNHLKQTKFIFIQKLYTYYINKKFEAFCNLLESLLIKNCFYTLNNFNNDNKTFLIIKKQKSSSFESSKLTSTNNETGIKKYDKTQNINLPLKINCSLTTPKFDTKESLPDKLIKTLSDHQEGYIRISNTFIDTESNKYKRMKSERNYKTDSNKYKCYSVGEKSAIDSIFNIKHYESDESRYNVNMYFNRDENISAPDFKMKGFSEKSSKNSTSYFKIYSEGYMKIFKDIIDKIIIKRKKVIFKLLAYFLLKNSKKKNYSCKILYRVMKRRVYFYKIKFFHRMCLLYTLLKK